MTDSEGYGLSIRRLYPFPAVELGRTTAEEETLRALLMDDGKGSSVEKRASSNPDTSLTLGCPFQPGGEEAARQWLGRPLEVPDLVVSREELSVRWSSVALATAIRMMPFALVVAACVIWIWDETWELVAYAVGAAVGASVLLGLLASSKEGPLVVSGARQTITLRGVRVASFNELGVPRRVDRVEKHETDWGKHHTEVPQIVMSRWMCPDVVLFEGQVNGTVLARMDEIADHINAMLAEYHQREVVRKWLEAREAELAAKRVYR